MKYLIAVVLTVLAPSSLFAVTINYSAGEGSLLTVWYSQPGPFSNNGYVVQGWGVGAGSLTASLDTETGLFTFSGHLEQAGSFHPEYEPDWFNQPVDVSGNSVYQLNLIDPNNTVAGDPNRILISTNRVHFDFLSVKNFPGQQLLLWPGGDPSTSFTGNKDLSHLSLFFYSTGSANGTAVETEGALNFVETPEPLTAALVLLGIPLVRRLGRDRSQPRFP